jgi:SAM-dependent methyltransferase
MSAIDTDIILRRNDPLEIYRALQHNGALRVLKTLARKALGVDARFGAELRKQCGVERFREPRLSCMSATKMTFPDRSFDFVYSHSVFEHIDDPRAALEEVRRVLRPGGVAYVSVHLYTCHSGSHDPKILAEGTPIPPLWPHLRPALASSIRPNTYLNRWRMAEWQKVFDSIMPGTTILNERQDDEIGDGLKALREAGELREYGDDELMTVNLIGIWQKPQRPQVVGGLSQSQV